MASGDDQPDKRTGLAHGEVCYLQIPSADLVASPDFYEQVFGWQVERGHAGFEAPGIIGQWVEDRPASADGGLLAWISVDSVGEALERARAAGGDLLEQPFADGPTRLLATIRDPAGNPIGIVEHSVGGAAGERSPRPGRASSPTARCRSTIRSASTQSTRFSISSRSSRATGRSTSAAAAGSC